MNVNLCIHELSSHFSLVHYTSAHIEQQLAFPPSLHGCSPVLDHLIGLVVKASTSRVEDPGFEPLAP